MRFIKIHSRILKHGFRIEQYFSLQRYLASWSSVACAFNANQSLVKSLKSQFLGERTGVFGYRELLEPNGFYLLKENAVIKAHSLMREMSSSSRKRKMVRIIDELSDTLCKVADISEFVRLGHPDERFVNSAKETSTSICGFVEELNTNREMYEKLKNVMETGDICATDPVDDYVAGLFLLDFEFSGIHLDKSTREQIVQYNNYILHLGSHFMNRAQLPRSVSKSQLPEAMRNLFSRDGETVEVHDMYQDSDNELLREVAYKIYLFPEAHQEELLNELLKARQKLANICGFPTFAHRAVKGSIAETPEFVHEFLRLLSDKVKSKADEDYSNLLELKKKSNRNAKSLMSWDVPYLCAKSKQVEFDFDSADYAPYFSLGACMDGLNTLFQTLYNVHLRVEEPLDGELWHIDVRKVAVLEGKEVLGWIYCDFFQRPHKARQECHFTIHGGRLCDDGSYQKPIVVLMLHLPNPQFAQPSLLNTTQVDNLFHEMGHAMHSMLARTTYQHVTGTRCSTDLAEVPSILMEYFSSDPRVVSQFARHWQTGETIPPPLANKLYRIKKKFYASDVQLQVFYAAYDQAIHSHNFLNLSTTELLAQMQELHYGVPYVPNTAWQLRFSHLVGYGAKYYSYLISRAVASWIWHEYFKKDPFSRTAGERYRNELLALGGSRHPRNLVECFLKTKITPEFLSDAIIRDINSESLT